MKRIIYLIAILFLFILITRPVPLRHSDNKVVHQAQEQVNTYTDAGHILQEVERVKKKIQSAKKTENPDKSEENLIKVKVQNTTYTIGKLQIEEMSKSYSITHEADGASYTVDLLWDKVPLIISQSHVPINIPPGDRTTSSENYKIRLLDQESNLLQSFNLEEGKYSELKFEDVNLDGYTDIVVNTGGTVNETHEFYIWDISSKNFTKVIFEGFRMLSYYKIHEEYIENFLKGSPPSESETLKLLWDGNRLIMDSKY